jgi:nitrogenase molybdenum-iron protein beta chain
MSAQKNEKNIDKKAPNTKAKNTKAHNTAPTNTIVHPRYGCSIGAANTVAAIPRSVPLVHCGPGCADKQFFMLSFCNGYQGTDYAGGGAMPSSSLGENEVVFGGANKLDLLIKSSFKIMKGDLFVVLTGCSAELVGDDVQSVIRKYREEGKPIVFAETPGFKGNNLIGHELVVKAIIDQFVGKSQGRKRKGLVNLWFEVPYYNTNWRGDYIEIKRILEGAGLKVNVLFGSETAGTEEWKTIPKAQFNLLISPWVGLDTVKHLEQKYNQPYLHFPVIPIGEEATTDFLRKVVRFAKIDPAKSERFIADEAKRYYYFLEHFSEFFSEYWFGLPATFAVVGDSAYNIALSAFIADQVGLIPVKHIITDNPPEKYREDISKLYETLTDDISAEVQYLEDGYLIEESLRDADFGAGVPLVLGTSWEVDTVKELGGLLLEVSTPVMEEIVINRSYVGYRGALTLLERIYSETVNVK